MDARRVWEVWRRILRDDELARRATTADPTPVLGLDAAERAVLADYARTPRETDTNLGMYRRGLVRNALAALSHVPLSQRLLYTSGLDVEVVAAELARSRGHVDDGPYFWRLAGAFVAYLATRPEFAAAPYQDVFALDRALVTLARRLGEITVARWPQTAAESPRASRRFVASPAAIVVSSAHDLTAWIESPRHYCPTEPPPLSPRFWLIYFATAERAPDYAELSERSARVFHALATPRTRDDVALALGTVSATEVSSVIDSLARLGVVAGEEEDSPMQMLTDEMFVRLDPAVEMLRAEVGEHRLLCHKYFELGMAVPPGGGLSDFLAALGGPPVRIGALREGFDDQRLIDAMLATLWQHGFLHATAQPTDDLAELRSGATQRRRPQLCSTLVVELAPAATKELLARIEAEACPPELRLRCARPADHAAPLAELAKLRRAGQLRIHHAVVECLEPACSDEIVGSLRQLGAAVLVTEVPWPAPPRPIAGLDALVRGGVPVHARMTPSLSLRAEATRALAIAWAKANFLTGLSLVLDADALWPATAPSDEDFIGVFEATRVLADQLGDVSIANLPSDEVLLGNAASPPATCSATAARFRVAYLRWRLPLLKAAEGDNTFSQTPESEEKLVRSSEDLLPNHPELLGLRPGSVCVDVCGGNGRVARRLSPLVGEVGEVISIELLRCVTDRARRFASERGFVNLQFRTGLAERLPLPDGTADAAVNEWTGAIWELGLGPAMLAEMARVVRRGGRIAVTHRLVRLSLDQLDRPWIQFADIHAAMQAAFARVDLRIVAERIWGQTVSTLAGEKATAWRKQYLPRLVNPLDVTYTHDDVSGPRADVCLTMIAERI